MYIVQLFGAWGMFRGISEVGVNREYSGLNL